VSREPNSVGACHGKPAPFPTNQMRDHDAHVGVSRGEPAPLATARVTMMPWFLTRVAKTNESTGLRSETSVNERIAWRRTVVMGAAAPDKLPSPALFPRRERGGGEGYRDGEPIGRASRGGYGAPRHYGGVIGQNGCGLRPSRDALSPGGRAGVGSRHPRHIDQRPRYFVRRAAWHILDHAWEIEDRIDGWLPR
jgi:hypothetical protein